MLKLNNLKFKYDEQNRFEYTLNVKPGTICLISGDSGIGKSTLLQLISGNLKANSGSITYNDEEIKNKPPWSRPISHIFQNHNLFPHLSCIKNVALGLNPSGNVTKQQLDDIKNCFAKLGIDGLENRTPDALSGGQQQRVAIARAILRKKPILLMDEPFSSLNEKNKSAIANIINKIVTENHICAIVVSHDAEDSKRLNTKTFQLKNIHGIIKVI